MDRSEFYDLLTKNRELYGVPYKIISGYYDESSAMMNVPWSKTLPTCASLNRSTLYNIAPEYTGTPALSNYSELTLDYMVKHNTYAMNHYYGYFSYAPEAYQLAGLHVNGTLTFPSNAVNALTGYEDNHDEINMLLTKIFKTAKEINESYGGTNDFGVRHQNDILISLLSRVCMDLKSKPQSDGYAPKEITYKNLVQILRSETSKIFNSKLSSVHRKMLYNSNSLYRRAIAEFSIKQDVLANHSFGQGLATGATVFSGLINSGYVATEDGMLKKEVNIFPEVFIRNEKFYRMTDPEAIVEVQPEDKSISWVLDNSQNYRRREWWVKSLVFDPTQLTNNNGLRLTIEGSHPNVDRDSGNVVCIGNENVRLFQLLTKDIQNINSEKLKDFFTSIEDTLTVINFDSSYYPPKEYLVSESEQLNTGDTEQGVAYRREVRRL